MRRYRLVPVVEVAFFQGNEAACANDEVVASLNVEQAPGLHHQACDHYIIRAGRGIARWVVVTLDMFSRICRQF